MSRLPKLAMGGSGVWGRAGPRRPSRQVLRSASKRVRLETNSPWRAAARSGKLYPDGRERMDPDARGTDVAAVSRGGAGAAGGRPGCEGTVAAQADGAGVQVPRRRHEAHAEAARLEAQQDEADEVRPAGAEALEE